MSDVQERPGSRYQRRAERKQRTSRSTGCNWEYSSGFVRRKLLNPVSTAVRICSDEQIIWPSTFMMLYVKTTEEMCANRKFLKKRCNYDLVQCQKSTFISRCTKKKALQLKQIPKKKKEKVKKTLSVQQRTCTTQETAGQSHTFRILQASKHEAQLLGSITAVWVQWS